MCIRDSVITPVSFELIGKGKELANDLDTEVTAVVLGSKIDAMGKELARHGADRVITVSYTHLFCSINGQLEYTINDSNIHMEM